MPTTYLGWTIVTMPATPWPSGLEVAINRIVAASTSPFTGQQQIYDWGQGPYEGAVSLPPLPQAQALDWITFLKGCNGMASVFTFPTALCAKYPESLTTDGSTPRYYRMKSNQQKYSIKIASIYGLSFDVREAT